MAPINAVTIGYGLSANIFHMPFILALPEEFNLYGVVQRNPTETDNAATDHPNIKTWRTTESMLADPAVHLVIVTSIPQSHFSIVSAAIIAGKHVLCEKPFVESAAQATELGALARSHGVVLSVYQNRRWDADFITLKGLIADKSLGRIAELESHFDRHRPEPSVAKGWKTEGVATSGAIYDLGSHLLDQFVALFGLPERVTAFIGNQRAYEAEGMGGEAGGDSFTVLLHYEALKMLGTAKAGVVSAEVEQLRYWVRGTKGSYRKMQLDVQESQLKDGLRPADWGFGVEVGEANGKLTLVDAKTGDFSVTKVEPKVPAETYAGFYRQLGRAIRGEGANPVSAEENANVIRLIEAARLSSKEGRTVEL